MLPMLLENLYSSHEKSPITSPLGYCIMLENNFRMAMAPNQQTISIYNQSRRHQCQWGQGNILRIFLIQYKILGLIERR